MTLCAPEANPTCESEPGSRSPASLFKSFRLKNLVLPNRFVMAPMTRGMSPGGVPTDAVAAYYRRRALGGVALIISEGTYPGHQSACGYGDVPVFDGDGLAGWLKVIHAVHSAGGLMMPQLWHTGSYRRPGFDRGNKITRLAPSAVAHPGYTDVVSSVVPEPMTESDMEEVISAYVRSAKAAQTLGFDGVEVHGAHGYLIDQFFWTMTNRRMDKYGGCLKDRTRFACEVVAAIRKETGPDFPILFRFSNWKLNVYDERGKIFHSPKDMQIFLDALASSGVDCFHASTRRFDDPEFGGSTLNLAGWTKKISGLPTITVGAVGLSADFISERQGVPVQPGTLDRLIDRMEQDEFDLVAVGRALLADPEFVSKVRSGEFERVKPYDRSCLSRLT